MKQCNDICALKSIIDVFKFNYEHKVFVMNIVYTINLSANQLHFMYKNNICLQIIDYAIFYHAFETIHFVARIPLFFSVLGIVLILEQCIGLKIILFLHQYNALD